MKVKELKSLIKIAGTALEAEDRFFLGAVAANQVAYPGGAGGLLRIYNERYYQFIIARALASSFPYAVSVEKNTHDLVLKYPNNNTKWFAVVEMKCWKSDSGEQEIKSIKKDIEKLHSAADNALLLVFSANPRNQLEENLKFLSERLNISPDWEHYSFFTFNENGDEVEFWVAGHEIR